MIITTKCITQDSIVLFQWSDDHQEKKGKERKGKKRMEWNNGAEDERKDKDVICESSISVRDCRNRARKSHTNWVTGSLV